MTSMPRRAGHDLSVFLLVGMLAVAPGCATPPQAAGHPGQIGAAPGRECDRLEAEIARTEQARGVAAEQGANAWKAVIPLAVLAQKASSTAAVHDADRKLAALKSEARGCKA
jgi:hypothetical protein